MTITLVCEETLDKKEETLDMYIKLTQDMQIFLFIINLFNSKVFFRLGKQLQTCYMENIKL